MSRKPLPTGIRAEKTAEVANRLNSAAIHLLRRIGRDDAADGVTGARLSALSVIVYGGPQTVSELARKERVATPTMTRIVGALVRDSLVRRKPIASDRRAVRLSATGRGRRLMERGRARRIRRLAEELKSLEKRDLDTVEKAIEILDRLEESRRGKEVKG